VRSLVNSANAQGGSKKGGYKKKVRAGAMAHRKKLKKAPRVSTKKGTKDEGDRVSAIREKKESWENRGGGEGGELPLNSHYEERKKWFRRGFGQATWGGKQSGREKTF